ncbi:DUF202 domain-containing protein [Kocuria sp. JC486]|uniref:DUF202 domain-containing protein n=1 Tax=Kocuria sp. JC486 TaxID=1970736 RepID=UPI0014238200|nr:DUF202 domain-containing protein [Kocuria sp. JC486]NHU86004.1 DUF202 domain-containing protein [Kocuria sp. JC486]
MNARHSAVVDPGLQPERTTLAWSRTLMAFVTVAALFLRWGGEHGAVVVLLFGGAIAVALAIGATQRRRYTHRAQAMGQPTGQPKVGPAVALSAAAVLLGAAGLAVILI